MHKVTKQTPIGKLGSGNIPAGINPTIVATQCLQELYEKMRMIKNYTKKM